MLIRSRRTGLIEVRMSLRIRVAFSFGLLLLLPLLASPNDWLWQHPVPQGNTLRSMAASRDLLIAVGDSGTVVRLDLKSHQWQHVASPTQKHLRAIASVSATNWVAVGEGGIILSSTDAGLRPRRVALEIAHLPQAPAHEEGISRSPAPLSQAKFACRQPCPPPTRRQRQEDPVVANGSIYC
jgi:hypothetical protein